MISMRSMIYVISMILFVFSWFPFVGAYLRSFSGHFFFRGGLVKKEHSVFTSTMAIACFGIACIPTIHLLYLHTITCLHMTLFVMIFAPAGRHIWYRHIARLGMGCLVWARFGMECIPAGHILYLRPSISRLSTSSLPPSSSSSSTSTSRTPNHPNVYLSISSSHCWIHFCQERVEEVLTGTVFQF